MTNDRLLAMLSRERQHTLLAQAQAARQAKQAHPPSAAPTARLRRALRPSRTRHTTPAGRAVTDSAS